MVTKKAWRFLATRLSLFAITFFVVASAIALAAITPVLQWETKPVWSWTIATSRWQKIHDFVAARWESWSVLKTPWSFITSWNLGVVDSVYIWGDIYNGVKQYLLFESNLGVDKYHPALYVNGNAVMKWSLVVWGNNTAGASLYVHWALQLTTDTDLPLLSTASCLDSQIWTLRLRLPTTTTGYTYCPLEICYPGTQTGHQAGTSRKSACDPVAFPTTPPNRTGLMASAEAAIVD